MQYINKEKTAAICGICGNVTQTQKTVLPNGNTRINLNCAVCGSPDVDVIKAPPIMEEKIVNPDILPLSSELKEQIIEIVNPIVSPTKKGRGRPKKVKG
jgi:hypothetical protein